MTPIERMIHQRLTRVVGARASDLLSDVTARLGITSIDSVNQLMAIAEALEAEAGFVKVVAQSLKAQALLLGADMRDEGAIR